MARPKHKSTKQLEQTKTTTTADVIPPKLMTPQPTQTEENEEYLFCVKFKNEDGGYSYSMPRTKQDLDDAIKNTKIEGTVCLCVIKPLCEIQISVSIPWDKAIKNAS